MSYFGTLLTRTRTALGAALAVALAFACAPAFAAFQIAYSATDLSDTELGKDLWRYDYVLTGHDFDVDDGVEILFPKIFFTELDPLPASGWDVFALPDEEFLPDAGVVAAPLQPLASPQSLSVRFVWLGGSLLVPGSQQFRLYLDGDLDNPLSGATIAGDAPPPEPIPEPGSILLLLPGLSVLAAGAVRQCGPLRPASV